MKLIKKRKISITDKFILFFIAFYFIGGFITSFILFINSRQSILNRASEQLTIVKVVKKRQIESLYKDIIENINNVKIFIDNYQSYSNNRNNFPDDIITKHISESRNLSDIIIFDNENKINLGKKHINPIISSKLKYEIEKFRNNNSNYLIMDIIFDTIDMEPKQYVLSKQSFNKELYIIANEVNIDRINEIMLENKQNEGLGLSGESYIVGSDYLLRSNSRFMNLPVMTIKANSQSVINSLKGESSTIIANDYRNIKVLSSYTKLNIPNLNWVLLAEIDYDEILIPINEILRNILFISIGFSIIIFVSTYLITRRITKPLINLTKATKKISMHKYDEELTVYTNDEVGDLTQSFNSMVKAIKEKDDELKKERSNRFTAVLDAQEQERQRLAQDLHDGIGQTFVALKFRLESISNSIQDNSILINEMKLQLDNAIDEIRRISNDLMPSVLKEFGLKSAISNLCMTLSDLTNIDIKCKCEFKNNLKNSRKMIYIYRVIQESLNNIIKHSKAGIVLINIIEKKKYYHLNIKDNGVGFTVSSALKSSGNGLYSMKERIFSLNGKIKIISKLNHGTHIKIIIPKDEKN